MHKLWSAIENIDRTYSLGDEQTLPQFICHTSIS